MIVWDLHFDGKNNWFKKGFPAQFELMLRQTGAYSGPQRELRKSSGENP